MAQMIIPNPCQHRDAHINNDLKGKMEVQCINEEDHPSKNNNNKILGREVSILI